jgi:hypothetical protein
LFQLQNNVVKAVNAANDRGAVADDSPLEHLQLQLQRSPEPDQALENFIDALHDPKSAQFHKFLSAQQFGARCIGEVTPDARVEPRGALKDRLGRRGGRSD